MTRRQSDPRGLGGFGSGVGKTSAAVRDRVHARNIRRSSGSGLRQSMEHLIEPNARGERNRNAIQPASAHATNILSIPDETLTVS